MSKRFTMASAVLGLLVVVSGISFVGCGSGDGGRNMSEEATTAGNGQAVSWLYAVVGGTARLDEGGTRIVVEGVTDVVAFTDRPVREAERLDTAGLAALWPATFTAVPPNAVLVGTTPTGEVVDVVVEVPALTSPTSGTYEAELRPIDDDEARIMPTTLTQVSLFIDNYVPL